MPDQLHKAQLVELDPSNNRPKGAPYDVQFNPESLKVTYANQLVQPNTPGNANGPATQQYVGQGTSKLSLQLVFDVTAPMAPGKSATDVRTLTENVVNIIKPGGSVTLPPAQGGSGAQPQTVRLPPLIRFSWGSFRFDGIAESVDESLEFWSNEGIPLRATMSLSIGSQSIFFSSEPTAGTGRPPGAPAAAPGTRPLTPAAQGQSVQGLADAAGRGGDWQSIASANGIENPRALEPGRLVDLGAGAAASFGIGIG